MPFYRFVCSNCEHDHKFLLSKKDFDSFVANCQICGSIMIAVMGKPESRSLETVDEYRNKKNVSDVSDMVEKRSMDHFQKNDLPKIIAEHGIEFAKRQGFVDEDGKPKK